MFVEQKNVTVYHILLQNIAVYRSISQYTQYIAVYCIISHFIAVIDPNSFDLVFVRSILATFRTLDMNQKLKLEPKQKLAYEFEVTRKILNLFFGSKTLHDYKPVLNI